ncbi:MAG: hypothetical protein IKY52_15275 [Clostridia bacterium]|nr:hypothetical protein [Clostridia bacterium]
MYIAICVFLMTGFIFLDFLHLRRRNRYLTAIEGVLTGAGVLLFPVCFLLLSADLSGENQTFAEWAWDSTTTYLRYALPVLGVFFVLTFFCALTPLWEKKYRTPAWCRIRSLTSLACAPVLLVLAGFFAALSATDVMPLAWYIRLFGIGSALLLRAMHLAEDLWQKKYLQRSF